PRLHSFPTRRSSDLRNLFCEKRACSRSDAQIHTRVTRMRVARAKSCSCGSVPDATAMPVEGTAAGALHLWPLPWSGKQIRARSFGSCEMDQQATGCRRFPICRSNSVGKSLRICKVFTEVKLSRGVPVERIDLVEADVAGNQRRTVRCQPGPRSKNA